MLWTLLIAMTNNPSENIWDNFTKTSKTGPSMESLNADFFQFFFDFFQVFFWVAS